jgi:DNA-binding response OmpR family regulator
MAKKILIIEDSPTTIEMLEYRLKNSGYDVISADNGETGLAKIKTEKPDLVVLDVRMPGMDGFEVCKLSKKDPETKDIPIVFLTTAIQQKHKEKGKEVGADGYITKPFDGKEMLDQIKKFLKE